ncbi:hypothetical protein ACP4OV_017429 [Aristida adscensionis]
MAASASAAAGETQKQLLSIIRDFASEKSHGERRVCDLKRRLGDLRAAADAAAAELDAAKRAREAAEQELRGAQVQAAIATASIQALEATISRLQEEIAKGTSVLDALKSKEDSERDEFISQMYEMNAKIRTIPPDGFFRISRRQSLWAAIDSIVKNKVVDGWSAKNCSCILLKEVVHNKTMADNSSLHPLDGQHVGDNDKGMEPEIILKDLVDKVNNIGAEVLVLEEEYNNDLLEHDKVREELADVQARRALMEAVMGETKQLQELGGYPIYCLQSCLFFIILSFAVCPFLSRKLSLTRITRTAEPEKVHASLAAELQQRYTCPGCGVNNMPVLEEAAATN